MDILFPHDKMRAEQDKLISDIVECIKTRKNMLIHAPTGIGKTAAVLSPALKYAIDNKKTVFFVTSKHTQHRIVIETLENIRKKFNIKIKAADFIGKRHMCLMSNVTDMLNSEFYDFCRDSIERGTCSFYSKTYEKNGALSAESKLVLENMKESILSVDTVINMCRQHVICPHEITAMHSSGANVIIADYFHVLSPTIRENILKKANIETKDLIVIIDEGHNLPERCRDLLSNQISTYTLEKAAKEVSFFGDEELAAIIHKIKNVIMEMGSKIGIDETERLVKMDEFFNEINNIDEYNKLSGQILLVGESILEEKKRSYAKQLASFMQSWVGPDEGFARILKRGFMKNDKPNVTLHYRCLDPSIVMTSLAKECNIIVMSGTLSPTPIYKDLFGFEAELKEYKDPFPKNNRLNIIMPGITTKYTHRDAEMYMKIASAAAGITNKVPGNSIVFFPSYKLLEITYQYFNKQCEKTIFREYPKLSKQEKEGIIEKFKKYKDTGAVLFACSSGSFGESIDLPGDYLKAVVVVGIPLAKPDLEIMETIRYYEKKFKNGWDYGYYFPALITCIQNAGRCIRSETDRGIIVFMDGRYTMEKFKKFFPPEWNVKVASEPMQLINEFFGEISL
ncbi:ATP-dependent DNA helicase [Candidatus Woesearchaeota archaeon]|nr:ATP-dependent DNA helicase [Candidatus Woesearchaeota archaeon]